MYMEFINLARKLSQYKKIVFYGAGYVASQIYGNLRKINVGVDFCIVTEKKDDCPMQKFVPVYQADDHICDLKKDDTVILIAVSEHYENDIEQILKSYNISNYLKYSEFVAESGIIENVADGIDEIAAWEMLKLEKNWKEKEFEALKRRLEEEIKFQKGNTILFLIEYLSPRALKIMKAMRDMGAEIKAISYRSAYVLPTCKEEFDGLGIEYKECECIQELMYEIIVEHARVVHMFSGWEEDHTICYQLVKMKSVLPPLVYDKYDIFNGFYTDIVPNDRKEYEKFCLENADGVCYREFSLEHLTDNLKFDIKGNTIRFFDYCSEKSSKVEKVGRKEENGLSLCYAGSVVMEEEYIDFLFGFTIAFIEMCERNGCYLHVYPSVWDEERYKRYIEKDKESEYFYFHKPVSYGDLMEELSQYDYGIVPTRDDIWDKEISGYNTKYKYIYATANKLFDYLDAGLPIISVVPLKMAEYLDEMGVLLKWTNGQYDFAYLASLKDEMKARVPDAREKLRIDKHIGELWGFYKSL